MKNLYVTILFALIYTFGVAQQSSSHFRLDSLPPQGILLDKGWKWHAGDKPDFAKTDFDDSAWESIDPTKDIMELPQVRKAGIGWLRLHLQLDSTVLQQQPPAFVVFQAVASELYSNGQLVQRFGRVSPKPDEVDAVVNLDQIGLPATGKSGYTLAVRIAFQPNLPYNKLANAPNPVYRVRIYTVGQFKSIILASTIQTTYRLIKVGMFFILVLLHFTFFIFYPPQKANLFFAISSLIFFQHWLGLGLIRNFIITDLDTRMYLGLLRSVLFPINYIFLVTALYTAYALPKSYYYWASVGVCGLLIGIYFSNYQSGVIWLETGTIIVMTAEAIRITVVAILRKHRGASIILVGMVISFVGYPTRFIIVFTSLLPFLNDYAFTFEMVGTLAIPLFFSVYLAREFAFTSKSLSAQLVTVQQLSAQNLAQEQEKQQILTTQNETLEKQVHERTAELEHKNRDLEIEAALERVRSRTMSMHKSEEVLDTANVLYQELKKLGFQFGGVIIIIMDEATGDMEHWFSGFDQEKYPQSYRVPYFEHPLYEAQLSGWRNSETYKVIEIGGELKKSYDQNMFSRTDYIHFPEQEKQWMQAAESVLFSFAYMKHGALMWGPTPISENEALILQRFAKVFEQTYTRFLDLQKAEAQTREVQIENALEKVRSRSLAMQKSTELRDVVRTVVERMTELGLNIASANIVLFNDRDKGIVSWTKTNTDDMYSNGFQWPYNDDPAVADFFDAIARRTPLFTKNYTFDEKNAFWKNNFERSDFRNVPADRKKFIFDALYFSLSLACRNKSGIVLTRYTQEPFSDADHDILQRFATVFEQAYTRFLDLEKAESQALEALRRSIVDRVRAEIASMRTTGDLERITPLIWNELTTLGVPFIRCGVFIMDEQQEQIHTFLSTPDGKAIASFNTSFSNPGLLTEALPHWRHKEIYQTYWDEATFLAQAKTLIEQGAILSPEKYLTESRPTGLYLHLLPFLQGMLYVGNDTSPLTDDQLKLVQTLADAFSAAYARYEDFNKLELAKKQVESTLSELKSTQAQLIQKEKLASLGELTAGIAHEIQNPLNFVNNFSELSVELLNELKSPLTPDGGIREGAKVDMELLEDVVVNLEKINLHGKRASSIVSGMLEHSKTSTGERTSTDLNKLANEYLRLSYHGLRAKDKDFNADYELIIDENLPKIEVIPQDIGRVLLNLINNAFWAVKNVEKPLVSLKTEQTENQIIIKVSDNGTGMSEATKAKIFQPFFTTKPTGQGTGLGLSLVYDIVTKGHGGTIECESVKGEGTTFIVKLPI